MVLPESIPPRFQPDWSATVVPLVSLRFQEPSSPPSAVTPMRTVAVADHTLPARARKEKESAPVNPDCGVYVNAPTAPESATVPAVG